MTEDNGTTHDDKHAGGPLPPAETPEGSESSEPATPADAGSYPDPGTPETPEGSESSEPAEPEEEQEDTFPRSYVEKLRRENKTMRARAARAGELSEELFRARVALDGRLSDPTALPYSPELETEEAIAEAVTDLLKRSPGLGRMAVRGDIGQGCAGDSQGNIIDAIRARM